MSNTTYTTQAKTASGINLVLGAWLVASPWIFGYSSVNGGNWNSVVIGALICVIGVIRVVSLVGPALARVNAVFGLWTAASPWIFGYATGEPAMWNSFVVGLVIAFLALWSANATVARDRQESHLAAGR